MAFKMDGETIAMQDGLPVWIYDDGKESPLDVAATLKNLKSTTAESVGRKEKIREFEAKLAPFTEIENPVEYLEKANKAIETVKNLDDKKLVDADQVELIKQSVASTFADKITGMETAFIKKERGYQDTIKLKDSSISNLLIKGEIGRSKFLPDKTWMPPSVAFDSFKDNFTIEEVNKEVKAVAVRKDGTRIMSLKDPGSYATVDEALETLVNEHPDKDRLLKGIGGGGGAPPNGQTNASGKAITREQFNSMEGAQQRDIAIKASKGELQILDKG